MPTRRRVRAFRIAGAVVASLALLLAAGARADLPLSGLTPRYAGPTSHFMTLDTATVHYRDEGVDTSSAPPLLLIHGTMSSLHTWDGWASRLAGRRRVLRLDLPGYGLTGPSSDKGYLAVQYARVVMAFLDRLGIPQVDLAGNSLGGRVALRVALDEPSRVRRMVLVDAAGLSGQSKPFVFKLAQIPILNRVLRWVTPRSMVSRNVAAVYGEPSRITPALVDRYDDLVRREGNRQALLDRMTGPTEADLDGRLGELNLPVLIEWGARDAWIPEPFGQRLHDGIRRSRLVVYGDAGHVPMEEIPEATARDAEAFLDDPAPDAP